VSGAPAVSWTSAGQKRRVAGAMRRIESRLDEVAAAAPGRLGDSARSTLEAGGKRLRPLLVVLCSRRDRRLTVDVVRAAAAVELLHMATLVHDDVLDDAQLRRGRPTVVSEHGSAIATSVGNYLFAASFAEVVATGNARAVARLSDVAADLSRGELLQMNEAHRADISAAAYLRRSDLKTAGLFGASCALGAVLSGLPPRCIDTLDGFGRRLGLAFQIFDDILDFSGDAQSTGKLPGTDVRDGTVTLPLVYAVEERPELVPLLERRQKDDALVARILETVRAGSGLVRARQTALDFIAAAREELETCRDDVESGLLSQIAGQVVDRYS
jgi:geranylgeranyl pyrophosphate synthase